MLRFCKGGEMIKRTHLLIGPSGSYKKNSVY